jgi:hypothetical protein
MEFLTIAIPALVTLVLGYLAHMREIKKLKVKNNNLEKENKEIEIKLNIFDKLISLDSIREIHKSVSRIFINTKADRFLVLIAVNGKESFNRVTVIFERFKNKDETIEAGQRYRNINVDTSYKIMLKKAELSPSKTILLETDTMENSLLKNFYIQEGVKHSKIRHLFRKAIDADNDVLVFSSIATHQDEKFTDVELSYIKTEIEGTVKEKLNEILK